MREATKIFLLVLPSFMSAPALQARTFTADFTADEDPISEKGNWANGKTNGIDWSDVRTSSGLAFGTQTRGLSPPYDDSIAALTGEWGANQFAEATVKALNCKDTSYQEVELTLRTSIAPNRITGYEFNFRCSKSKQAYAEIVRWNGKIDDFTYLAHTAGSRAGVKNGDKVSAVAIGNLLQSYINGVLVAEAFNSTFSTGSPGVGFFVQGKASPRDCGFTSFTASDVIPSGFHLDNGAVNSRRLWDFAKQTIGMRWIYTLVILAVPILMLVVHHRSRREKELNDAAPGNYNVTKPMVSRF